MHCLQAPRRRLRRDLVRRVEGVGLPVTAIVSTDMQPPDPGAAAATTLLSI
jgi:hypothetical protein